MSGAIDFILLWVDRLIARTAEAFQAFGIKRAMLAILAALLVLGIASVVILAWGLASVLSGGA
jgi:hypothetical protein